MNDNAGAALSRGGAREGQLPACPACGASARREGARFCATCGRSLREREYRPGDGLRASYRWPTGAEPARRGREGARARARRDEIARPWPDDNSRRVRLTSPNRRPRTSRRNGPTAHAYVLMAYALMPYVGIVFCPVAVVCGAAGLRRATRERHPAAEREAEQSIVYAIFLTGAQALLWLVSFTLIGWM